ncbi:hypothetical protein DRW07_01585 [Alteromonas sediminis]|uniref:Uncharacterized protein n=1 Tax=Alteromonas sediminis TaxID=2259342 RepID=A0A3N5Y3Z9_9ALTE|nr:hypothetical protein [Alteromonas sediminis]RPJ68130.1 hypothetical protein DRW07_01585 [Alteromonas sediminis]
MRLINKTTKEKWTDWLIESLLICASILLAFWLNEWEEQHKIENRTQVMMCNVKKELVSNLTLVESDYLPRHRKILSYLESAIQELENVGESDTMQYIDRPLYMVTLDNTAWSLAVETGNLSHLDFSLAATISRVYKLQEESLKQVFPRIIDKLFFYQTNDGKPTLQSQKALRLMVKELISQEVYILSAYNKAVSAINETEYICKT